MKLLEFPKVDTPSESMLSLATSDVIHRLLGFLMKSHFLTICYLIALLVFIGWMRRRSELY